MAWAQQRRDKDEANNRFANEKPVEHHSCLLQDRLQRKRKKAADAAACVDGMKSCVRTATEAPANKQSDFTNLEAARRQLLYEMALTVPTPG